MLVTYSMLIDEEYEAQRGYVTCPELQVMEPGFVLGHLGSSIQALNHFTPSWAFLSWNWSPFTEDFLRVPIALVRRLGYLDMGAWSPCPCGGL